MKLCIYHGKCADGFTAAWAVRHALGDDVEFFAGTYQDAPPDVTGRDVIMVDFSYKRPVLEEMATAANSIVILDHHKSAQADLIDFTIQLCGGARFVVADILDTFRDCEELGRPKIIAEFDMERSGAQMAWDFFHPNIARPLLVDYVGDRDLWKFEMLYSREVNAFVGAHELDFQEWDSLHASLQRHVDVRQIADLGAAIDKKHHKDVVELVGLLRRRMVIGGHSVWVANLPHTMASDAGHLMAQDEPFSACYFDSPDGRAFSLRSTDAGQDVSEIAKLYGGGGHRNAAGFRLPHGVEP